MRYSRVRLQSTSLRSAGHLLCPLLRSRCYCLLDVAVCYVVVDVVREHPNYFYLANNRTVRRSLHRQSRRAANCPNTKRTAEAATAAAAGCHPASETATSRHCFRCHHYHHRHHRLSLVPVRPIPWRCTGRRTTWSVAKIARPRHQHVDA